MQKKSFCRRSSQPISWVSQSSHLSACSQVTTGSMLATHPNTLFSALHWWHLPLFTSTLFYYYHYHTHTHTHNRLLALCPGLPGWAGTRKVKPVWILLKQVTVSGSGISWAVCKSAPRSREITMPASHHSVFYRPDALPAAQPTASKHWRPIY